MKPALFHYAACGLDYVYLAGGVRLASTPYGETFAIDGIDALNRRIALEVSAAPFRLRGQEVRFLRAQLDLSQTDLARMLGTSRASVARWEAVPDASIPGPADRALRLLAVARLGRGPELRAVLGTLGAITDEGRWRLVLAPQDRVAGDAPAWTAQAA